MRKRGIDRQAEDYIITEISALVMDLGLAMQEFVESGTIGNLVLREWSTRERICALWRKRWRKRFDYPTEKGTPAKRIRIEKKTIYNWRSLEAA